MFSLNNSVNFRQKIVVLVGFQIGLLLLTNVYCACEYANLLNYEIQVDEMADHYEGIERVRVKLESEDLHRCCTHRDVLDIGFDGDEIDNKRIEPAKVWFMDPMDIIHSNMDKKYKEGKYLLFVDNENKVFVFDLNLIGYDTEMQQGKIKEFLDR